MSTPIVLHLDRSSAYRGLYLERDGRPVSVEEALRDGFTITADDAPCLLTLAARHVEERDRNHN